jgi:hypothetical protein
MVRRIRGKAGAAEDAGRLRCLRPRSAGSATQAAIEDAMVDLKNRDGTLEANRIRVRDCTRVLEENLARRDSR